MVVFGNWEKPPLWILRNKLIENRITREETISGNSQKNPDYPGINFPRN